jgi:hypothetical protein
VVTEKISHLNQREARTEVVVARQGLVQQFDPNQAPLQVQELTQRMQHVQAVIKQVMREDVHFGVIPGTKKKTLLKEGSEILLNTFHIAVDPEVEDLSTDDVVKYRVRCVGRHIGTGNIVGYGLGMCSSNEDKYKWRRPVCKEEYDTTPEDRRRIKFAKGSNNAVYKNEQIRTNPDEVANTILKMAKKRAQIDLTLTCLAASDSFSDGAAAWDQVLPAPTGQPVGSVQPGASQAASTYTDEFDATPKPGPVVMKSDGGLPEVDFERARPSQISLIEAKLKQCNVGITLFLAQFNLGDFLDLPADKVREALDWIGKNAGAQ